MPRDAKIPPLDRPRRCPDEFQVLLLATLSPTNNKFVEDYEQALFTAPGVVRSAQVSRIIPWKHASRRACLRNAAHQLY